MNMYESFCLSLPETMLTYPFDQTTKVLKVANKMFAIIGSERDISLKCDPERALDYREIYDGVRPGYHLNKMHWNTVSIYEDVSEEDILYMIVHSYESVVATFPKKQREQLQVALKIWKLQQEE